MVLTFVHLPSDLSLFCGTHTGLSVCVQKFGFTSTQPVVLPYSFIVCLCLGSSGKTQTKLAEVRADLVPWLEILFVLCCAGPPIALFKAGELATMGSSQAGVSCFRVERAPVISYFLSREGSRLPLFPLLSSFWDRHFPYFLMCVPSGIPISHYLLVYVGLRSVYGRFTLGLLPLFLGLRQNEL